MDTLELKVLRKQTRAFIADHSESVAVSRKTRASDGAGGYTYTYGAAMAPQTMRLIPAGEGRAQLSARNVDGEIIQPAYVLLGAHDANVQLGDRFTKDGRVYEVIFVRPDRRYETWAEVAYRG